VTCRPASVITPPITTPVRCPFRSTSATGQDLDAERLERLAHRGAVVDHQAEVPVLILRLRSLRGQRNELIAHVDERHGPAAPAQREFEQSSIERERLVDVADFQRNVVDADQARPTRGVLGHALTPFRTPPGR
jgi:hypothetical protein